MAKKALPWRGGSVPAAKVDLKKVIARLQEVRNLDGLKFAFAGARVDLDPSLQAALKKRIEGPVEAPEALSPEVEGAFLCLMGANDRAWRRCHEIGADMVHFWCQKGSLELAVRSLLINACYNGEGQRTNEFSNFPAFFPYLGPWKALRNYTAFASETDYQAAWKIAREEARGLFCWLVATAFPTEREYVRTAVEDALSCSSKVQALGLLASVDDPDLFARLCQHLKEWLGSDDFSGVKLDDFLGTAVARLGDSAWPGVKLMAQSASKAGDKKMLGELIVDLRHPEVGPWLEANKKDKAWGPFANRYANSATPAAPAPAPAPARVPTGKEPAFLLSPPWENRVPKPKPKQFEVKVPAVKEAVHYAPARMDEIRKRTKRKDAKETATWKGYFQNEPRYATFPDALWEMQDHEWALKTWNETPSSHWNPYGLRSSHWITVPEQLLGTFGAAAIPGVLGMSSVAPEVTVAALEKVESPRLAAFWAEAWATKRKFRKAASGWFLRYPETAAAGLLPLALGPTGKARTWAEGVVRWMCCKGQKAAFEAIHPEGLEHILSYDPLQELPARMPALPSWLRLDRVESPYSQKATENLLLMVAISNLDTPYPGLQMVSDNLEELAWSVYQQWLAAGGPPKEDWGFKILAYFGGDTAARRIVGDIRRWPGEGLSSRAATGLDILRFIGTDVALMNLHGIALKLRFKALQEKAQQHIQQIADERGLSTDELADRLVPDLDVQTLKVRFDEHLRPTLLEGDEKSAAWKALKKDAKAVAAVQIERLEQAMIKRRRWDRSTFELLLVNHPLLIHLVRRLVWTSSKGTFRVAEDNSYADLNDQAFQPEGEIGIAHPVEVDLKGWTKVFSDYAILQPFEQLHRAIHQGTGDLNRYRGLTLPGPDLLLLERRGWHRGAVESGCLLEMVRGSVTLGLDEGLVVEDVRGSTVVLGRVESKGELHPVEQSELVRDLESLKEQARVTA